LLDGELKSFLLDRYLSDVGLIDHLDQFLNLFEIHQNRF